MSLALERTQLVRTLRNRDLALLLAASLVSQTGDWILSVGVAFEVYALTGSTVASAAVLLATLVPQVLLSSFAGAVVDRRDRRRTMLAADLALAVVLLPLVAVHRPDQVWIVVVATAASSCLVPFFLAAEASLLPAVVPERRLVTANAVNGQVREVARLIGAALGGVGAAAGGFVVIALADAATFVLAALLIALVRHRAAPAASTTRTPRSGFGAVRGNRLLTVALVFFVLAGVGEGVMGTLFAPFVHDVLGGGGTAYGGILASQAVGGIVAGFVVSAVGHRFSPRVLLGWGAVAFGALDLALFLSPLLGPALGPAALLIAVVGLPGAAVSAGLMTVFQLGTTDADRGRAYGALLTARNATMLAGTAAAGLVAAPLGVLPVIVVQGLVYLTGGVVALILLRRPTAEPGEVRQTR